MFVVFKERTTEREQRNAANNKILIVKVETMAAFEVEILDRAGNVDKSRFFDSVKANDFLDIARSSGKNAGGAIVSNTERVADFGLMRNGTSLRAAKKAQRG